MLFVNICFICFGAFVVFGFMREDSGCDIKLIDKVFSHFCFGMTKMTYMNPAVPNVMQLLLCIKQRLL